MPAADRGDGGLVVREIASETVIYDPRTQQAHCLGRTAAAIWRAQDGRVGVVATARLVSERLQQLVDEAAVRLVWRRLRNAGLLRKTASRPDSEERRAGAAPSRRRVAYGVGAAAGLMVLSIATRSPAQVAATCTPNGRPCTRSSDCCSHCCNQSSGRCTGGGACATP